MRHWAVVTATALALGPGSAGAQAPSTCAYPTGFRYVEHPDQGRARDTLRQWAAEGKASWGVDIDSRIEIAVDRECLLDYLRRLNGTSAPDTGGESLQHRLRALRQSVATIPEALKELEAAFLTFERNTAADSIATRDAIGRASRLVGQTLDPLEAAIKARLMAEGVRPDSLAQRQSQLALDPVMQGTGLGRYDWDALRVLLAREIQLTQSAVDSTLAGEGYQVEIRAHLMNRDGAASPIFLRGYNEVATGPETRFERFQTVLAPEQAELYREAQSLEQTVGNAKSVGEAFRRSLELEFSSARAALEALFADAAATATRLEGDVRRLQRWGDTATFNNWVASVNPQLDAATGGDAVRQSVSPVAAALTDARQDLETLRQFADLKDDLRGVGADVAMTRILARVKTIQSTIEDPARSPLRALQPEVWRSRVETVRTFFQTMDALPQGTENRLAQDPAGPVGDLKTLLGTLDAVVTELQDAAPRAVAVLGRLAGLPVASAAADLPEPTGQRRLGVATEIGTEIALRTIQSPRDEHDQVVVDYRFFRQNQPAAGAWSDHLQLEVYGWRSRVLAGLAFTVREHTRVWQPGAAVSWIISHRSRPGSGETGTGDPAGLGRFGAGLTTINLRFEGESGIQLGVGPTLSLLGERLLLGCGWNLQAEEDQFYGFFSLRLFTVSGGTGAGS